MSQEMIEGMTKEEWKKLTPLEQIYVKFKNLKAEAKIDTSWEKTNLETSFNCTMNLTKWITKKTEWMMAYRSIEEKRKKLYRGLYTFYQTDFDLKLSTKAEYDLFIESDLTYVDNFNMSLTVKEIIGYCDSIIETLKNKQWEIRNYIEWIKFQNGR